MSNIGTWIQTIGAQWFLLRAAHAAILVSLVQTADMLPDALFAIVGGVLADTLDRRRPLMAVQGGLRARIHPGPQTSAARDNAAWRLSAAAPERW
jgi:MFS family permease